MLASQMADYIVHRGPDDSGLWVDAGTGIALAFRRLAILDLSPTGHQPMLSADSDYVIIFNGEIYNFAELRSELSALGVTFRGRSDTEIMLAAIVSWGLEQAVRRFNGSLPLPSGIAVNENYSSYAIVWGSNRSITAGWGRLSSSAPS